MSKVRLYDTTLRDGSQGEDISFSVDDKLHIARKLDEFRQRTDSAVGSGEGSGSIPAVGCVAVAPEALHRAQ